MSQLFILPVELLVDIFRFATDSQVRSSDYLVSWSRFEPAYAKAASEQCKDAIRTKYALSLVCALFRKLSLELLYEDIWVRHGSDALLKVLESSRLNRSSGLGDYVKRVSLSLASGCDATVPRSQREMFENARRILMCCPNIRVLARPQEAFPEEDQHQGMILDNLPIDDLTFRFLNRVEWHNTPFDLPFAIATSPRFIWNSDSLRVLIIGADNFPERSDEIDPETVIHLQNVHTLGIRSFNTLGSDRRRYQLSLPSLHRLVVGRPEAIYGFYSGSLAPLGPQIREIELEPEPRFLRHDFVSTLLGYCPNATELCIPVATTRPLSRNEIPRVILDFPIRRVYLHAGFPGSIGTYDQNDFLWWSLLQEHFEALCAPGSRLTALENIILCGLGWKDTVEDIHLVNLFRLAKAKGVNVTCEDEQLQHIIARRYEEFSEVFRTVQYEEFIL